MPADLVPLPSVLLELLGTLGVDVARVLDDARISRPPVAPRTRLTTREFFAFWRAVEEATESRDLGLRLGSETLPHQLDVASLAALHAPNLGEALKKLARYKSLVRPEEMAIEIADGEARIRFHWVLADEHPPMLVVDGTFASAVALARRGTGKPISPRRIELTRRRTDEAMLARHFRCELQFDAPIDLVVFDESALAEPFVTCNEDVLAVMVPGLEAGLAERATTSSLADDVRMVLARCMHGEKPTVEKIADAMHMSPRTLQRRLEAVGTTYQELLDDVRHQSAKALRGFVLSPDDPATPL